MVAARQSWRWQRRRLALRLSRAAKLGAVGLLSTALSAPPAASAQVAPMATRAAHQGLLPPSNPPASIPPVPDYYSVCETAGATPRASEECLSEELEAIDAARAVEGLGALHLPSDFLSLAQPEQVFVLTDIERTDRGLPPYVGLVASLDKDALQGAEVLADPVVPGPTAARSGALAWGSIEAEDISALSADYIWMYDDGPGSMNVDCTPAHPSGCWGHRDNILWDFSPADLRGRTLVAGAAECAAATIAHVPMNSYTEIVALLEVAPSNYVYTWAEAEAAGAR